MFSVQEQEERDFVVATTRDIVNEQHRVLGYCDYDCGACPADGGEDEVFDTDYEAFVVNERDYGDCPF